MKEKHNRSLGRPRSSDKQQPTEAIILKAATRLFLEDGYQNVSIDDVAEMCNVTKATVYYYYDSKADLFTETMVQLMKRIREKMLTFLQEDLPLRDRLLNVTKAHLKATVDIDMDGFIREAKNTVTAEQTKKMHEAEREMNKAIEKAFVDAMVKGEIREINPTFATQAYLSLLKVGNYKTEENHSIFQSFDETSQKIVHFFWQGLFSD